MPVTLLVEVKQQLGALVPGWVTVWHVLFFHEWVMVWAFLECQLRTKPDTVDSQRVCANIVGCVVWCVVWCVGFVGSTTINDIFPSIYLFLFYLACLILGLKSFLWPEFKKNEDLWQTNKQTLFFKFATCKGIGM